MKLLVIGKDGNPMPQVEIGLLVDRRTNNSGSVYTNYWVPPHSDEIKLINESLGIEVFDFSMADSNGLIFAYTESDGTDYMCADFKGVLRIQPNMSYSLKNNSPNWVRLHSRIEK